MGGSESKISGGESGIRPEARSVEDGERAGESGRQTGSAATRGSAGRRCVWRAGLPLERDDCAAAALHDSGRDLVSGRIEYVRRAALSSALSDDDHELAPWLGKRRAGPIGEPGVSIPLRATGQLHGAARAA